MKIIKLMLSDIKNIVILILIVAAVFFKLSNNRLTGEMDSLNTNYHNQLAASDSIREISDNTFQKLAFLRTELDIEKIEKEELEIEVSGKITEINKLSFAFSGMKDSLESLKRTRKIDTVFVDNKLLNIYTYPYADRKGGYAFNGVIGITTTDEPHNVDFRYDIALDPINLTIFTHKNSDFSYSVTVKSDSKFAKLVNSETSIPSPELPGDVPFYEKMDIGLGGGIDNTGSGFLAAGLKYSNNLINVTYSGENGNYGMMYQRFLIGN